MGKLTQIHLSIQFTKIQKPNQKFMCTKQYRAKKTYIEYQNDTFWSSSG